MNYSTFGKKFGAFFCFFILALRVYSQGPDCVQALVICSDGDVSYNPQGPGIDDFADPDNFSGCLTDSPIAENQSAWYYFEFQPDMPPNSVITFTIIPDAGSSQDYDFAVFGPDVECDNLGSPLRCSYSGQGGNTGLSVGAGDDSEGAGGDAVVNAITVQPGQGFYLVVDNFSDNSSGFSMSWGEDAAPFLNCDAVPGCEIEVSVNGPFQLCPAGGTLNLTSIVTGTMGVANYSWVDSNGSTAFLDDPTSPNPTVTIPAGTGDISFILTVTDDDCSESAIVDVTTFPGAALTDPDPVAFCYGEEVVISVPDIYQTYIWSNGATSSSTLVNASGTYSVTVIDANGCTDDTDFMVTEHPEIVPVIAGENSVCIGNDATFGVLEGAFPPYYYDWSTGEITPEITVFDPGIYTVTVHDAFDCFEVATWEVTEETFPEVVVDGPLGICSEGTATITAAGGFPEYYWNTLDQGAQITVSEPGVYEVSVIDANGCLHFGDIDIEAFDAPSPEIIGNTTICSNDSTELSLTQSYQSYEWSTTETTPSIFASTAGDYSVTVSTPEGCEGDAIITINEQMIAVEITGDEQFCVGQSATISVPNTFMSYHWSNGGTTNSITVQNEGDFSVTVTDNFGCSVSDTIHITELQLPTFAIDGNLAICPNGQTILSPDSTFQSYLWSDASTNNTLTVNAPGTYSLTVTDNNGCSNDNSVVVAEEAMLNISLNGDLSVCDNQMTEIGVDGMYASYQWSTGASTPTVSVGDAGFVTVTVQDAFGCVGIDSVSIEIYQLPSFEIAGANEYCEGLSTVLNTNPSFVSYQWNDGSIGELDTISSPGVVSVTVTDANGCENSEQLQILENANPTPQIEGTPLYCPNESTSLNVVNSYTSYNWSTGSNDQATVVDQPGDVFVTVVDENGCVGATMEHVSIYDVIDPMIDGALEFCPEGETSLNIVQNFENYNWSTGDSSAVITIGEIGAVGVTVLDNHGCETSASVMLTNYDVMPPSISGDNDFCEGLTANIIGQAGFEDYLWSTNESTPNISVSSPGDYFLTVTDNNGCQTSNSVTIEQHPTPEFEINGLAQFCVGFSTQLYVDEGYASIDWSTGQDMDSITVNAPGLYVASVVDNFGCQGESDIVVQELESLTPVISGDLDYCENTSTTLIANEGFATYQWSNNMTDQEVSIATPGNYGLTVTDESGCTGETMVTVVENPLPNPEIIGDFDFCPGETAQLSVNTSYESYLWSSGDTLATITTETAGLYGLTVIDGNGCANNTEEMVVQNPVPDFAINGIDYFCQGTSTDLTVSDSFVNYDWSNGAQGQSTTISTEGLVSVEVENELGCKTSHEINIDEIELPEVTPGSDKILDCEVRSVELGVPNASIPENWAYVWSGDGLSNNEIGVANPTVDTAGVYSLYLWDEQHQCQTETFSVEVEDVAYVPTIVLNVLDTLNCLLQTVRISANGSEAGNNINYNWYKDNEQIPDEHNPFIYVSSPGMYAFEVIDEETHCLSRDEVEVIEDHQFPIANAGTPQHLDCNTTEVTLVGINSQTGPTITYEWHPLGAGNILAGGSSTEPVVNSPGFYELVVSESVNGCSNADTVEVTQNILKPVVDAGDDQTLDCQTQEVMLQGAVSNISGDYSLNWSLLGNSATIGQTPQIFAEAPGLYQLEAVNLQNGCKGEDEVEVILNDNNPKDFVITKRDNSCYQANDAYIVINETVGGTPPFLYSFNGGDFSSLNLYNNLSAGEYSILVQDANGCELETTLNVLEGNDLAVELGDDLFIDFGESVNVEAQISIPVDSLASLVWQLQDSIDCLDPACVSFEATPTLTTNYHVTVSDDNGCIREDDLTVYVNKPRDVFIPSGFTPNGDGLNDKLIVFAGKHVAYIKSFVIFNRWGEIVYEIYDFPPNNPTYGWDGNYRSEGYNATVFTYFAEVVFIDGEEQLFKGDVTLVK